MTLVITSSYTQVSDTKDSSFVLDKTTTDFDCISDMDVLLVSQTGILFMYQWISQEVGLYTWYPSMAEDSITIVEYHISYTWKKTTQQGTWCNTQACLPLEENKWNMSFEGHTMTL